MDIIKVSGSSRTSAVAGAIAGVFREQKHAEVQAIGAGAVNQAVKALVLAKGYLAEDGFEVVFSPEFVDVEIDGKIRTAVKLTVDLRHKPVTHTDQQITETEPSQEENRVLLAHPEPETQATNATGDDYLQPTERTEVNPYLTEAHGESEDYP